MPPKTTAWTDDAKEAQSEKSIRARIKAAAAYKGCSVEELAAMPESELLKLPYLGRKTVEFLKKVCHLGDLKNETQRAALRKRTPEGHF